MARSTNVTSIASPHRRRYLATVAPPMPPPTTMTRALALPPEAGEGAGAGLGDGVGAGVSLPPPQAVRKAPLTMAPTLA